MPLATTAAPAKMRMLPGAERVDFVALVVLVSPAGTREPAPVDVDKSPAVLLAVDGSLHAPVLHVCSGQSAAADCRAVAPAADSTRLG